MGLHGEQPLAGIRPEPSATGGRPGARLAPSLQSGPQPSKARRAALITAPMIARSPTDLSHKLTSSIALAYGPCSHLVTLMDATILIRDLEGFRQARPAEIDRNPL
jgi:hypothetical protein